MKRRWSRLVGLFAVMLGGATSVVPAQQPLPAELQATIIVRVLAYDRAFKVRGGSAALGVVFKGSDKVSAASVPELLDAFRAVEAGTVQGMPLSAASRRYRDALDLSAWMASQKIGILYVTPGLAEELDAIRDLSMEKKVVTVSPVRSFVERGLAIGLVPRGDKVAILVNRSVADSIGMDLDPKLLRLAEVLR